MSASPHHTFDQLVESAAAVSITGWDFSYLRGRVSGGALPWDYRLLAQPLVEDARHVLDVDTGGGEFFSTLRPPRGSVAVEPYAPNLDIARRQLGPLGIDVIERPGNVLPVPDQSFDLVLNRHGHLDAEEIHRVLVPGGRLLSQQVGPRNDIELNEALDEPPALGHGTGPSAAVIQAGLKAAGFGAVDLREATVTTRFLDVGAVVFQLRAVPWQVPEFHVVRHRPQLLRIHDQIQRTGALVVRNQRFLIQAQRTD